jgi:hypothetical protein
MLGYPFLPGGAVRIPEAESAEGFTYNDRGLVRIFAVYLANQIHCAGVFPFSIYAGGFHKT